MLALLSILFSLLESIPLLLRHRLHKKVVVPSLWYFRALQSKKTTEEEGGRNISLKNWLSILLLFLIAAAIINFIGYQETFQRSVYIIDTSASMQVIEDNDSRLEMAIAAANRQIRSDKPHELMVIAAGINAEVVVPFSSNPDAWQAGLDGIQAIDCESDLSGAILAGRAALGTSGGSIYCFTDAHLGESLAAELPRQFQWIKMPDDNRNNVGIINLNDGKAISNQSPFFVDLKNYSLRPLTFDLLMKGQKEETLFRETIEFVPNANQRIFIDPNTFKQDLEEATSFTLELEINDALSLDNKVYGYMSTIDLPNIYLVSTQNTFAPALEVFANYHQYDFYQVDQGKYYALDINEQDLFVFDGFIPEKPEGYNSLIFQSGNNFTPLTKKYQLEALSIHHPILSEVSWELFDPLLLKAGNSSPDNAPQLSAAKRQAFYQLARISPSSNNNKWVILNKDIYLSPGTSGYNQEKEQVAYKLLFNALGFVSGSRSDNMPGRIFKSGEIVSFPANLLAAPNDAHIKIELPNEEKTSISPDIGIFIGEQVGAYQLESSNGKWAFALNLLDDRISSLEGRTLETLPMIELAELEGANTQAIKHRRPRAGLLLLIILLLALDWVYFYYIQKRMNRDELT